MCPRSLAATGGAGSHYLVTDIEGEVHAFAVVGPAAERLEGTVIAEGRLRCTLHGWSIDPDEGRCGARELCRYVSLISGGRGRRDPREPAEHLTGHRVQERFGARRPLLPEGSREIAKSEAYIGVLRYPVSATAAQKPLSRKGQESFPSWTSPVRPRSPALSIGGMQITQRRGVPRCPCFVRERGPTRPQSDQLGRREVLAPVGPRRPPSRVRRG